MSNTQNKSIQSEMQIVSDSDDVPPPSQFQHWLTVVQTNNSCGTEVTIRIVDEEESAQLNERYRQRIGPTNVLAFPSTTPEHINSQFLGDLVICAPVVLQEAIEQKKIIDEHWAHMVIHGVLHLLGYDHQVEGDAKKMEAKEIELLEKLGYANPY